MFCKNCGKEIQGTLEFCPNCGAKQTTAAVAQSGNGKSKIAAILLAVFLTFFTWLYTYKKDSWKFWTGLVAAIVVVILNVITLGIAGLFTWIIMFGIWLWAVIDTATKTDDWYKNY